MSKVKERLANCQDHLEDSICLALLCLVALIGPLSEDRFVRILPISRRLWNYSWVIYRYRSDCNSIAVFIEYNIQDLPNEVWDEDSLVLALSNHNFLYGIRTDPSISPERGFDKWLFIHKNLSFHQIYLLVHIELHSWYSYVPTTYPSARWSHHDGRGYEFVIVFDNIDWAMYVYYH